VSGKTVLIIDDEENMRHMLETLLKKEGYHVSSAADGQEALEQLGKDYYDTILCDVRMPKMDGISFLRALKEKPIESTIIMMSAFGNIDTAIEAMKLGAYDYISKPFKPDEVLLALKKAEEREHLRRENVLLKREVQREYSFENIVARSSKMHEIFDRIRRVSSHKTSVLITGESGTGKELIARAIHYSSPRKDRPFLAVNCGAIPDTLLESELFGHVKGAFTGAIETKKGVFEEADDGTLFLDEIGDIPLALQVKLMRVLQEGEIKKVGSSRPVHVDVRIVAATARDLSHEVERGTFREELFYRLNVLSIVVPPLKERREDIPLLVEHFIKKFGRELGTGVKGISKEALDILLKAPLKGNVRELENVIEQAMILSDSDRITLESLPENLVNQSIDDSTIRVPREEYSLKKVSKVIEEELIRKALRATGGNRTRATKLLEISHPSLLSKIKKFKIDL
jgi:two-component system response regulator AtoC